ncbi:hypothetical protein [Ideonella livida]|uniref:hypothetical protein n=1 Tax=Ideonella livida TaxID=2707176 RepID=UPI00194030C1|nr:hypothetical protein [Ideonella livida]
MSGASLEPTPQLLGDIRQLIERSRTVMLHGQRTGYCERIVSALPRQLGTNLCSGIHVAEYLTVLPSKEVLQAKLQEAIANSRARLENRGEDN